LVIKKQLRILEESVLGIWRYSKRYRISRSGTTPNAPNPQGYSWFLFVCSGPELPVDVFGYCILCYVQLLTDNWRYREHPTRFATRSKTVTNRMVYFKRLPALSGMKPVGFGRAGPAKPGRSTFIWPVYAQASWGSSSTRLVSQAFFSLAMRAV